MESHAGTAHTHEEQRTRLFRVLLAVLYLLALSLLILWEYHERLDVLSSECSLREETKSSLYSQPYSRFLNWASPDTPGHVVTVAITENLEEIQSNLCLGRAYLADVLRTLVKQNPSVVVIDKFYSPNSCATAPESTRELKDAVKGVGAPVVIGESTNGIEHAIDGACLVRKAQLEFDSPNVIHGLTRLNTEPERFPLRWEVLAADPEGHEAENKEAAEAKPAAKEATPKIEFADSLTLATVKAYDPAFVEQAGVQRLIRQDDHAYANLGIVLPRVTSTELLCSSGDEAVRRRWSLQCGAQQALPKMLGKIVLIGAENASDERTVLDRHMWGFQMHARYIESLLSGDYLRSPPIYLSFVLFVLFVFLIEGLPTILLAYRPHWKHKRILCYAYAKRRYLWVVLWAVGLVLFSAGVSLALRYLPPLLVYGDILLVTITRLMYFSAESAEHPFVHAHAHAHRKAHAMTKKKETPAPAKVTPPVQVSDPAPLEPQPIHVAAMIASSNRPGGEGGTAG